MDALCVFCVCVYSGYAFMLSIQAIHSCYLFRLFIHAIYSGYSFMLSNQAIHSGYLFRLSIQDTSASGPSEFLTFYENNFFQRSLKTVF